MAHHVDDHGVAVVVGVERVVHVARFDVEPTDLRPVGGRPREQPDTARGVVEPAVGEASAGRGHLHVERHREVEDADVGRGEDAVVDHRRTVRRDHQGLRHRARRRRRRRAGPGCRSPTSRRSCAARPWPDRDGGGPSSRWAACRRSRCGRRCRARRRARRAGRRPRRWRSSARHGRSRSCSGRRRTRRAAPRHRRRGPRARWPPRRCAGSGCGTTRRARRARRMPWTIPVPTNQWCVSGSGSVIGFGPLRR